MPSLSRSALEHMTLLDTKLHLVKQQLSWHSYFFSQCNLKDKRTVIFLCVLFRSQMLCLNTIQNLPAGISVDWNIAFLCVHSLGSWEACFSLLPLCISKRTGKQQNCWLQVITGYCNYRLSTLSFFWVYTCMFLDIINWFNFMYVFFFFFLNK